jgi:hypothetical protein
MVSRVSLVVQVLKQMLTVLRLGSHTLRRDNKCGAYVVVDGGEGGGINIGMAAGPVGNRTIDRDMQAIVATLEPEDAPFAFGEPLNETVSNNTQPGSWYA